MSNAYFKPPKAENEAVLSHAPGSEEREELQAKINELKAEEIDIPMVIGGEDVYTDNKVSMHPPHELSHTLGTYNKGTKEDVQRAVKASLDAKEDWANLAWQDRAAIFLKAADLLAGPYRSKMNAATMLGQSKNVFQSEIDAVCELADFYRYNVEFMTEIYEDQPENTDRIWNRTEYRPLEGFVFAITPFNFTSIAGNLGAAPALVGNTVVWKVASTQVYSAAVIMEVFREAGLPDGVINMLFVDGSVAGETIFTHPDFAGLHFTGSTNVFQSLWQTIGNNISTYKSYPRIVGETGGKDFVIAHPSADAESVSTALTRGAFEFQGQKCSAASRAYIPKSLWSEIKNKMVREIESFSMGSPEDFGNFINAVIDETAFDKISSYIAEAKKDADADIIIGGDYNKEKGYFIEPTVIRASDPRYTTMVEEIFGPVLTIYVYDDEKWEETMEILDKTSPYGLTGAVFSRDRYAIAQATRVLRHAAGNFYINDKPTGAVVGKQPFGGGRKSGTNDKAGSTLNLHRWISQRTIKENFVPPTDYRYPFMGE